MAIIITESQYVIKNRRFFHSNLPLLQDIGFYTRTRDTKKSVHPLGAPILYNKILKISFQKSQSS